MSNSGDPRNPSTRWWLARPGQQPIGPYLWSDLVTTVKNAGGVADWMACPEGGSEWKALASDPALVEALTRPSRTAPEAPREVPLSGAGFPPPTDGFRRPSASSDATQNSGLLVILHLSVLADILVPFLGIILPLALWLANRSKPDVDMHGKEVMNWVIFVTIAGVSALVLVLCGVGLVLLVVLGLAVIVCAILGAVKASKGELFRYPMPFRLIK